jgi:hypothetical protein
VTSIELVLATGIYDTRKSVCQSDTHTRPFPRPSPVLPRRILEPGKPVIEGHSTPAALAIDVMTDLYICKSKPHSDLMDFSRSGHSRSRHRTRELSRPNDQGARYSARVPGSSRPPPLPLLYAMWKFKIKLCYIYIMSEC